MVYSSEPAVPWPSNPYCPYHKQQTWAQFSTSSFSIVCRNTTTQKNHNELEMATLKKRVPGMTAGTPKRSKSRSPPKTPPRPRVMCPGCSTELTLHKTLSISDAFIYASKTDMKKLGIECKNDSCILYIEGIQNVDDKLPVNPIIEKCVDMAEKERAVMDAAKKEDKKEIKKRKREEEKAEYANYDPFSGAKEKAAEEAIHREKRQKEETEKIIKSWQEIQNAAANLDKLEGEGDIFEE